MSVDAILLMKDDKLFLVIHNGQFQIPAASENWVRIKMPPYFVYKEISKTKPKVMTLYKRIAMALFQTCLTSTEHQKGAGHNLISSRWHVIIEPVIPMFHLIIWYH